MSVRRRVTAFCRDLTPHSVWKNVRHAILVIAIIGMIATSRPCAATMLIFIPSMVALCLLSIGYAAFVMRIKN